MDPLIAAYVMFIIFVFLGMALIDLAPLLKRSREVEYGKAYTPKTLVMVPCRGEDLTLKDNLVSISAQNYKNYSVMAIVDSADDPAVRYIRQAGMKFIVSDHKGGRSSGKVRAIITALKRFRGYDAYVIADSDILVGKNWLGELISPLQDGKIGVSTTFPKFVPRAGFWSKVKLVWGFVGEGMMKSASTRFGWGGSLAFRKELVNRKTMAMLEDSRYSVSDDICITRAAREAGLGLAYVGSAQPIVNSDDSFRKFIEWANRQTALSILGYRRNLYYGAAFYSAEILLFVSGIALSYFMTPLFLILLAHFAKSEIRTAERVGRTDPSIILIVIFMPVLYLANLLAASRTDHVTWRGRRYAIR